MSKGSELSTQGKNELKSDAATELTAATTVWTNVDKTDAAAVFKARRRLDRATEKSRQVARIT